jgi:integrase/recombinase XerC
VPGPAPGKGRDGPLAAGLPHPDGRPGPPYRERHAPQDGRLLRYADGRPVTYRRYDGLWVRIGRHLPWARTQQISTHWLRHTTLTWVERNFGFAVAHAYAGHTDGAGDTGSATSTYVRATLTEVATALAALTGEPHPLAEPEGGQHGSAA